MRVGSTRLSLAVVSVFCLATLRHVSAESKKYTFLELSTPGDSDYIGRGLNNLGQVAGRVGSLLGTGTRAFVWNGGGNLERVISQGTYSAAAAINDVGEVVGSLNSGDSIRAFLSSPTKGTQILANPLGDSSSQALSINKSGDIVGYSSGPSGQRACLWSQGRAENLTALSGTRSSKAVDISDSGHVVGSYKSSSATRAFLWTRKDGMQDLGVLPGDKVSEAFAVNDDGDVVGYSQSLTGMRAFLWTRKKGMQDLGFLPGAKHSRALDINKAGEVTGASSGASGARAFIWTSKDGMKDLNLLISVNVGLLLAEAHAINDRGQITVLATDARDGHEHEGPSRLFVLTPGNSGKD